MALSSSRKSVIAVIWHNSTLDGASKEAAGSGGGEGGVNEAVNYREMKTQRGRYDGDSRDTRAQPNERY